MALRQARSGTERIRLCGRGHLRKAAIDRGFCRLPIPDGLVTDKNRDGSTSSICRCYNGWAAAAVLEGLFERKKMPMMQTFHYTNPITRDPAMSMRDHQILKVGDLWYMTGTSAPYWKGPNPGVRLFSSANLLDWKFEAWLIDAAKLPDDCFYKGRFWAPEIHPAHDRFWLTVNTGHYGPTHGDSYQDGHAPVLFAADRITGPYALVGEGPLCRTSRTTRHCSPTTMAAAACIAAVAAYGRRRSISKRAA